MRKKRLKIDSYNNETSKTAELEANKKAREAIKRFQNTFSEFSSLCRENKVPHSEVRIEIIQWVLGKIKFHLNRNQKLLIKLSNQGNFLVKGEPK